MYSQVPSAFPPPLPLPPLPTVQYHTPNVYHCSPPPSPPSWQSDMADKREVPAGEGEQLARQLKCPFFETSAKLRSNVEECFHELVRQIKRLQQESTKDKPEKPSGGGCCVLMWPIGKEFFLCFFFSFGVGGGGWGGGRTCKQIVGRLWAVRITHICSSIYSYVSGIIHMFCYFSLCFLWTFLSFFC